MSYIAAFVVFAACVKLLTATGDAKLAAGVFAAGKVIIAFLVGGGALGMLVTAVVVSVIGFGYFWLLDRFEGSNLWWVILICGVVLFV